MMRTCPDCDSTFSEWVTVCVECGTSLVQESNEADQDDEDAPERIVYELGDWPLSMQARVAEELAGAGIEHVWDGTDLLVDPDDEVACDEMFDRLEAELGGELDPGEESHFTLAGWNTLDRDEVAQRLAAGSIPFRRDDEGGITVAASDEELVVVIVNEVGGGGDAGGGPTAETLGNLFVAADRLKSDAASSDGLDGLVSSLDEIDPDQPPFGLERGAWRRIVEAADELGDGLADEASDPDHICAMALRLRDLLRPYV